MSGPLNAKILIARCSKNTKMFGIRIEQRGREWNRTWAFPIEEDKAQKEGFEATTISSSLVADPEYPGCPHCESLDLVQCPCGKMGCYGGVVRNKKKNEYLCPWCKNKCYVEFVDRISVSGGGY